VLKLLLCGSINSILASVENPVMDSREKEQGRIEVEAG
jgi:hypothetical protein